MDCCLNIRRWRVTVHTGGCGAAADLCKASERGSKSIQKQGTEVLTPVLHGICFINYSPLPCVVGGAAMLLQYVAQVVFPSERTVAGRSHDVCRPALPRVRGYAVIFAKMPDVSRRLTVKDRHGGRVDMAHLV